MAKCDDSVLKESKRQHLLYGAVSYTARTDALKFEISPIGLVWLSPDTPTDVISSGSWTSLITIRMTKLCVWVAIGALVLTAIIIIAAWPRESTDWCNSDSDAGECKFGKGDQLCYCINTFPKLSEVQKKVKKIFNAAKLRCEQKDGVLATLEQDEVLQSVAKRMFEMGVEKAVVSLRKVGSGWFWIKADGEQLELLKIVWRIPPQPQDQQGMVNVETLRTPADQYEYNWNYYNYDYYRENHKSYVWYGFSTCNDTVDKDAYYICQYTKGHTIIKQAWLNYYSYNTLDSQLNRAVDKPDSCYCGGKTTIDLSEVDDTETFHSPGYPKNYCSDNYCRWLISAPVGLAIQLDFMVFSLEKDMDFVYVYEGHDPDSPVLQTCTSIHCSDLKSSGHELQVLFHADHITTDLGFRAKVTAVETDICYCSASMSVELTSDLDSYSFMSPAYPEPYCPGHNCGWTITVPKPLELMVNFNEFDLGNDDFVTFFGGQKSLKKCTGTKCKVILSEVSKLTIHFNSSQDAQGTHSGFRASVMALRNYCERFKEGTGYSIKYSNLRTDGNVPGGAQATVTCADKYKLFGTIDTVSEVIQCELPMAKWKKDVAGLCVAVCEVPEESEVSDLENVYLCDTGQEPRDRIHNVRVQQYNFNIQTSQYVYYTCIDHAWSPSDIECNHMKDFKILILGGEEAGSDIEFYSPDEPQNKRLLDTKLLQSRKGAVSARLSDGSVLTAGGSSNGDQTVHSSCEIFWPESLEVSECAPLTSARAHAAAAVLNGVLHVCGGLENPHTILDTCEKFSSKAWEPIESMQLQRMYFTMVALDGFLFVIGGQFQQKTIERYDPTVGQWTPVADMNQWRSEITATALWHKIFACSYINDLSQDRYTSDCEFYEPETDTWTMMTSPNVAYSSSHQILVATDTLFMLAGGKNSSQTVAKYDRKQDKWIALEKLIKKRVYSSAVVIP